jgi:hypothetical protein
MALWSMSPGRGRLGDAETTQQRALTIKENVYGPNHHETALTRGHLATVAWELGRRDEAISLMAASQAVFLATFGADHEHSRWAAGRLADWQA